MSKVQRRISSNPSECDGHIRFELWHQYADATISHPGVFQLQAIDIGRSGQNEGSSYPGNVRPKLVWPNGRVDWRSDIVRSHRKTYCGKERSVRQRHTHNRLSWERPGLQ
jgi:hypothetical protein